MFELFDAYRRDNTSPKECNYCDVDYLLRFWKENKDEYLRPLFGDSLILEKEVEYVRDRDELRNDMYKLIRDNAHFIHEFVQRLNEYTTGHQDDKFNLVVGNIRACLNNSTNMVENILFLGYVETWNNDQGYDYKEIKSFTFEFKNGHKVQLQAGMKITRAMTQLCKQIGLEEDWEVYRIKHSQVLNQKKLKGTLCLSIHPLDYATASDNDNGWSSCMSWREEGCYRMGTVEMMNSPMVICAYLRSDTQYMSIRNDNDWNSKKWRAWIIVTKDVILCNRHYPYHQEHFAIAAVNWVKELVGAKYGWMYEDVHTDFLKYSQETGREVEYRTNYMYNDIGGDDVIGCFREGSTMWNLPGYINFSGPAECMVCGEEIPYDVQEAGTLMCNNCRIFRRCSRCECELEEEDCYYGPDNEIYCEECYHDLFRECEVCGCVGNFEKGDIKQVIIPFDSDAFNQWKDEVFKGHLITDNPDIHPQYAAWRILRYFEDEALGTKDVCRDCIKKYHILETEIRNRKVYMPDPNYYTMREACDLIYPAHWDWIKHSESVSWMEPNESQICACVNRFYEILWEVLRSKYSPN